MAELQKTRIDKWLWAVRLFKTRSIATTACTAGKVKIDGQSMKPSRQIKVGETVTVKKGLLTIVYEVTKIIEKRVSAPLAAECYIDHSPPPPITTFNKKNSAFVEIPIAFRKKGDGRPTKKHRREIDRMKDASEREINLDF